MKRIAATFAAFAVLVLGASVILPVTASALDPLANVCTGANRTSEICQSQGDDVDSLIVTVVNVLLFIVGALAVVMIIFSGILYTTSSGDSGKVSRAKNTLTYSIVGLIVAFLAYAIINWVLDLL